jgi:hypothetical protein
MCCKSAEFFRDTDGSKYGNHYALDLGFQPAATFVNYTYSVKITQ